MEALRRPPPLITVNTPPQQQAVMASPNRRNTPHLVMQPQLPRLVHMVRTAQCRQQDMQWGLLLLEHRLDLIHPQAMGNPIPQVHTPRQPTPRVHMPHHPLMARLELGPPAVLMEGKGKGTTQPMLPAASLATARCQQWLPEVTGKLEVTPSLL